MSAIIDMALYAGKTGQMLRLPNIQRSNGFYKVPVSFSEVRAVFESDDPLKVYQGLCATPRAERWCTDVREVKVLGDFFKRLAIESQAREEARIKDAKARCTEPTEPNEILGAKIIENMVGKIRHVGPDGKSMMDEMGSYEFWSKVAMAFIYVGCVYDCLAVAYDAFMRLSRDAPGWTGPAAVYKRLDSIKHDEAKSHITHRWVFSQRKGDGFRDVSPTGRGTFKSPRNARDVLAEVIAETDRARQRAILLDELTVAALEACELSGWRELTTQVKVLAKEHHVKRELDGLLKEFKSESGNQTDDDLKSDAKFLKWVKTVATFGMDTDGIECMLIRKGGSKKAYELNGGAWLSALADVWLTTTGGESGGVDRPFHARLAADSLMTFKAMARASEIPKITRGERKIISGGFVYLDAHHKAYRIGPGSWCELSELPDGLNFRRNADDLPMPEPLTAEQRTGVSLLESVRKLAHIANIDVSMCPLIAAITTYFWCHETGNYILVITGEPGTGKTTLMMALRRFIHPSRKACDSLPRKLPDYLAISFGSDVITLDNCGEKLSDDISDAMMQQSTSPRSTRISSRLLYTNHETVGVPCGKLIAMTGITDPGSRGDYLTRSIRIEAVKRSGNLLLEAELIETQDKYGPEIMGAMLDVAAGAMLKVKDYGPDHPLRSPDQTSRMLSADLWTCAVYETLGLTTKDAVQMLRSMRNGVASEAIENDPVLSLLLKLDRPIQGTTDEISKELLKLKGVLSYHSPPSDWPKTKALTNKLKLNKSALERCGLRVEAIQGPRKQSTQWRIEPAE